MRPYIVSLRYKKIKAADGSDVIETAAFGITVWAKSSKDAISKYKKICKAAGRSAIKFEATLATKWCLECFAERIADAKINPLGAPPPPVASNDIARQGLRDYFDNCLGTDPRKGTGPVQRRKNPDGSFAKDKNGKSIFDPRPKNPTPYLSEDKKWCLNYNFGHGDIPEWYPWHPEEWTCAGYRKRCEIYRKYHPADEEKPKPKKKK